MPSEASFYIISNECKLRVRIEIWLVMEGIQRAFIQAKPRFQCRDSYDNIIMIFNSTYRYTYIIFWLNHISLLFPILYLNIVIDLKTKIFNYLCKYN